MAKQGVPVFVSGKDKKDLIKNMIRNNQSHGIFFHYFDISFADGEWVAWFLMDTNAVMKESLSESES